MKIHPDVTPITSFLYDQETTGIYLIRRERNVLVDTGTRMSPKNDIAPALDALGLSFGDIDLILNTHGHPDHNGGNQSIQAGGRAQILLHEEDLLFSEDHDQCYHRYFEPVFIAIFGRDYAKEEKGRYMGAAGPNLTVDRPLKDGDKIELGPHDILHVVHLPGHTPGSVGYFWENEGILFSGDSLPGAHNGDGGLPVIYDLEAYRKSIRRVKNLPVKTLVHAHPFRGIKLPPNAVRPEEEVKLYLDECLTVSDWIISAADKVPSPGTLEEVLPVVDRLIAAIPKTAGFRPLDQTPLPRYNALTILSAFGLLR